MKVEKIKCLWPDKRGLLKWRTCFRIGDNPPQATRRLAIAWAR